MRKVLIFLCSAVIFVSNLTILSYAAYNSELVSYAPDIFFLANTDTDVAVFSKNAKETAAPASLVKIATAVLAIEFCENIDTEVTVSKNAVELLYGTGSSIAGLVEGEKIKMRDLIYVLLLTGANDAANVIAEYVAKDIPTFINLMNDFANALGCENTNFANAHGLDNSEQKTTAYDMYLILKHAIKIPLFREIVSVYDYKVPATNKSSARVVYNRNPMINKYSEYYYKYMCGGITGSTELSGESFASFAQKDGYTYICIAMKGAYKAIGKSTERKNTCYAASKEMYGWVFDNMRLKVVADSTRIIDEIEVKNGKDSSHVALIPEKEVTALVPLSAKLEGLSIVTDKQTKPSSISAPVKKGEVVAKANIYYSNTVIATVNLVALNDIERSSKKTAVSIVKSLFTSKPFYTVLIIFATGIVIFSIAVYILSKKKSEKKRKLGSHRQKNPYTQFKK